MEPTVPGTIPMIPGRSEDLLAFAGRCRQLWGRPEASLFPEVERRISLLAARENALSDCLLVVLLGGTKVGKTTLVNALAGREIGEASARACFTSRPALYVHESREAQARSRLSGVLEPGDRCERHREASLERIILVDAPDIDGIEATHHEVFDQLLERADLAICAVTTQKYDSAALYKILGEKLGFRRTVFVFNRIDEGIPFSDAVREDFLAKIGRFSLRPPEGEQLPVFAVSALHALQARQGRPTGPRGEFPAFEALLRERLDQALVKRISEENLQSLDGETREFVAGACHLKEAREAALQSEQLVEATCIEVCDAAHEEVKATWQDLTGVLEGRRSAASAATVGGPFGMYLSLILAIRAMSNGLSPAFITPERAVGTLIRQTVDRAASVSTMLSRRLEELLDRQGVDPHPLLRSIESATGPQPPRQEELTAIIRDRIGAPQAKRLEAFLLNLGPLAVILLLVRYFVVCLFSAQEPGAGMFIGGGLLLWLICHLQATFWLPRQSRALGEPPEALTEALSRYARARLGDGFRTWRSEVESATSSVRQEPSRGGSGSS